VSPTSLRQSAVEVEQMELTADDVTAGKATEVLTALHR
jgi:hypothetical protein